MAFSETIFLTGFPGFIASRLTAQLSQPDVQFYLLVQTEYVDKAISEIESTAANTGTPLENFALIEGDITKPDLGINAEDLETLRSEITDVYHLAAVYDLAVSKETAHGVNVEGTRNVNDFVRSITGLKRYNYVSTCYVAGKREGKILETELEHDSGFRNHYEEAKYLAELEVEKVKTNLSVTIFRPSVVVGDSQSGETVKYDGIYYLIHYLRKAPNLLRFINVGNRKVKLNLVPVDFVAKAIATLARDDKAIGKTVAIADPRPLMTAQLFDTIAHAMTGKRSAFAPPPEWVEWTLSKSFSPPVSGLPLHGVPYFFVEQTYDTSIARELLADHAIVCPRFESYVENLLKFVETNPKL